MGNLKYLLLLFIPAIYAALFKRKQIRSGYRTLKFKRAKRKLGRYNKGFFKENPNERGSTRTGSVYSALRRGNY